MPASPSRRTRPAICDWWECTPPGDSSPMTWTVPPVLRRLSTNARKAGRRGMVPCAKASSMRGRSCSTTRPAPRFMWPTSELPICPAGRPTWPSDASSRARGQVARSRSHTGVRASAMALPSDSLRSPHPSKTHKRTGRGIAVFSMPDRSIAPGSNVGRRITGFQRQENVLCLALVIGMAGEDLLRPVDLLQ